ncbi:glycosyltransferase family 4 protein [Amycolatopsis balhimycina DSM 5908]|uniref:Glycosyltransferase family 4 protein n=1 Tax=Amycolatopsis balhimycina DSM 5908 TaxID=1081091 RepID=A0A428X094_AMYBA|nr:glycosyltransferase [Amycolatopsis balhimycina]RSM48690.1 glycosyltransferase family 4 protein [Amycolatopsis balhimycina DSM 5908]
MLTLAIGLAAAGACCFAATVHLQHQAVRGATTSPELGPAGLRTILRTPGWYAGIGLAGLGAALHVLALTMAPLAVVQPIGVLTLVLTVFLARTVLTRAVLAALAMSVTGVAGFVALSAMATNTALPAPGLGTAQWAVLAAAGLAVAARFTRGRARCLLLALATAVLFGFTSALVRAAAVAPLTGATAAVVVAEAGAATLAGAWLLHQAYASGPAPVVAGATTIADPLSAVLIGVFAYGEMTPGRLAGIAVPGVVAVAGLLLLAREVPAPAETASVRRPRREGPLRVAITADTYPPDVNGAANFAYRLASGLAGRGNEVHVVCPSPTGETFTETAGGVTVHRIGSVRTPFHPTFRICPPWRTAKAVPALLAGIDPDVVHTQAHFLIGRSAVRAATAARNIPVVATNHFMPENLLGYGPLPRWTHRPLARLAWHDLVRIFGRATVCTTPTPRAAQLLEQNGLNRPVMAISCGIDRAHYAGPPTEPAAAPSVLFVGRLDAEKNVHELLEAAVMLPPHVRVELVGDGSERARLEAQAARLGIADRVTFHGFVPDEDLVRAYRRCAVFCMPGTAELQSLVTMEAMAAGKPVVAADAMALPHLVHPGRNGWLYPPGDPAELARLLTAVLTDERTRTAMGKASLDLIGAHDLESTLDQFEGVYADIATHPVIPALSSGK